MTAEEGQELTLAQREALSNIEVVRTAGHRYLVEKWGDGTVCDMTGKPRDIEVQVSISKRSFKRLVLLTPCKPVTTHIYPIHLLSN